MTSEPLDDPMAEQLKEGFEDIGRSSLDRQIADRSEVDAQTAKTRLRIRFTKCGDVRWISHRDLARVWERLLRRAGLQLAFSQGFHPKPKISFPSALALGIEALDEVVELEVLGAIELDLIDGLLRREMPAGMDLLELQALQTSLGKAKVLGASYRILHGLDGPSLVDLCCRLEAIRAIPNLEIDRDGKTVTCPTDHPHFDLQAEQQFLLFSIPNLSQGSVSLGSLRPSELLAHVGLGHLLESGITLQRTAVHLADAQSS